MKNPVSAENGVYPDSHLLQGLFRSIGYTNAYSGHRKQAFHSGFYADLKAPYPQDYWNLVRSHQKVEAAAEEKIKAISDEFRAAGLSEAADEMAVFARQEGGHGFRLEALINRFAPEETSVEGRKVYRCPVCGYEYVGDLESEPDDYVCPLCGQPKKAFVLKK